MTIRKIYRLPLLVFVLMPSTFILTYVVAVALHHVSSVFPYISDTGTFSPESCIFGQLLNISSLLLLAFGWIRYRQVKRLCLSTSDCTLNTRLNMIALVMGAISCLGISMVANFQETNILSVHMLGAFFTFSAGGFYLILQTFLSFRLPPEVASRRILHARLAITVLSAVATLSTTVSGAISLLLFHGEDMTKWKPQDGGYVPHVISAMSEWMITLIQITFVVTFVPEFRGINVEPPDVWSDESTGAGVSDKYQPLLAAEVDVEVEEASKRPTDADVP